MPERPNQMVGLLKTLLFLALGPSLAHAPLLAQIQTGHPYTYDGIQGFSAKKGSTQASEPSAHAARFDVTYYHLTLNLNGLRNPILLGRNRIVGRALANTDTLQFDLSTNMVVDFVGLTSGRVMASSHQEDRITIALETTLVQGEMIELDIVYHGNPTQTGFGAFTSIINVPGKPNTIWTLSEPYGAREWWPSDDHPSDKADSVRVTVRVPSPMTVASNGLLLSKVTHMDGASTFDWKHRYPISTYLVSLAIGEYDVYTQTYSRPPDLTQEFGYALFPIQHFAYAGSDAFQGISPSSGWNLALEMMPVFEDWFGPYPFQQEKYGHAHFTVRGGMEHQTISSMGNIGAELIAHELAHQWFGDQLTPSSWRDLWLNEGFATMSEFLIYESDPKFAYLGELFGRLYFERALDANGTLVLQDTTHVDQMFAFSNVYAKGYMVLRMIRGIIGDEQFKAVLRAYVASPGLAYASVTTEDFQRVLEEVTGRSFQTFFDQWVYSGTGYPVYETLMWDSGTDGMHKASILLRQTQGVDESTVRVFELPVWLEITTEHKTVLVRVDNDQAEQTYEIELDSRPLSVRVDPFKWLLRGDSGTILAVEDFPGVPSGFSMSVYPNPVTDAAYITIESEGAPQPVVTRVFDALGRMVLVQNDDISGQEPLNLRLGDRGLSPGVYLVQVQIGFFFRHQTIVFTR